MTEKQPDIALDVETIKPRLTFDVARKPGKGELGPYPLLVHAPSQWGPGIRTEDKGIPVADIAMKAAEIPDYDRLAAHFSTTAEHVRQAIACAVATQPKPEGE